MSRRRRRERAKRRRHAPRPRAAARRLAGAGLGVGAALAIPASAQATVNTFTVNAGGDAGDGTCDVAPGGCTLRDAVDDSNDGDTTDLDTITFAASVTGTITLNGNQLPIVEEPLYVNGPGAGSLTVSGAQMSRILYINAIGDEVTIEGLTLSDGSLSGAFVGGGAILGRAELTVRDSVVSHNSVAASSIGYGAGIWNDQQTLTVQGSTIGGPLLADQNIVSGVNASGAGIYSNGDTTIEDSVITGNLAAGDDEARGGGLWMRDADTTIDGATISDNFVSADETKGGGLYAYSTDPADELEIVDSTISGNLADGSEADASYFGRGGGIYAVFEATTIKRSTISGNRTNGASAAGGGLFSSLGLHVQSSTISGNDANQDGGTSVSGGGGVYVYANTPASPEIDNSIVANNTTDATGPDLEADSETFQLAFSLIEDTSGSPIANAVPGSNITGVDPQLGALGSNGGPTETHALPATSPAVDKGNRENGTETTDQRGAGFVRPVDVASVPNSTAPGADGTDIGAFELQSGSSSNLRRCAGLLETSASNTGTPGRDVIVGTSRRDVINGKGGNDVICGLGGNDALLGRGGRDTLRGQRGKDKLKGGAKRDKLFGGPGPDRLIGGPGRDLLRGQAGRDTQIQ